MVTKNKLNYFGLLALIIAVVLAACSDGSDSENRGILTLSGQVNKRKIQGISVSYSKINKSMDVSDGGMGGSGKIKNGKLSYSIKKPADAMLDSAAEQIGRLTQLSGGELTPLLGLLSGIDLSDISGIYTKVNVSPDDTQAALLNLEIRNNVEYGFIDRERIEFSSLKITINGVSYVYVDKKSTITATGNSITVPIDFVSPLTGAPVTIPIDLTFSDIKLNLEKGWNALGINGTVTVGLTGGQGKIGLSCQDPSKVSSSLKWVANPPGIVPLD